MTADRWKRKIDRWKLVDGSDAVLEAVTHEFLANAPNLFDRERLQRGWPPIPPPPVRPEPEWIPWTPDEVVMMLGADERDWQAAMASRQLRMSQPAHSEADVGGDL